MDVRLSPEQQALRDSVAQVVDRLGATRRRPARRSRADRRSSTPRSHASGWRELRTPTDGGDAVGVRRRGRDRRRGARPRPRRRAVPRPDAGGRAPAPRRRAAGDRRRTRRSALIGGSRTRVADAARSRSTPRGASTALVAASATADSPRSRWCSRRSRVDLTRPSAAVDASTATRRSAACARRRRPRALDRPRARAHVAPTSSGTMRGAVELAVRLRRRAPAVRRGRSARSRRCSTCWPTPSWRRRARAAPRCTRRGPSTRSHPTTRSPPARWPRRTAPGPPAPCARPPSRCTAASATRGSAWPTSTCGGRCSRPTCSAAPAPTWPGCSRTTGIGERRWTSVTRRDEAEFRLRLREWLDDNNPGLPASSTDDDYWAGQAAWHQSLYDAGFFGMSWPNGHRRPGPAERLRRHPRRGAGRRRRAAASEPRLPGPGHPRARQRRHPAAGSCPASSTDATAGARASASPTPARTSRRCAPGPIATATTTSSPATRSGRATPTTPTGASSSPAPTTTSPSTRASRRSRSRWTSPASSSDRCR